MISVCTFDNTEEVTVNTPNMGISSPVKLQCACLSTAEILSEAGALSPELLIDWTKLNIQEVQKVCSDFVNTLIKESRLQYPDMYDFVVGLPGCEVLAVQMGRVCRSLWTNAPGRYGNPSVLALKKTDGDIFQLQEPAAEYDEKHLHRSTLIIDSTVTTGRALSYAALLLGNMGFSVKGAVVVCDAGNLTAKKLGIPYFYSLISRPLLSS
jgi:hypothetical protein